MTLCIRVLGPLAIEVDGHPRRVGGVTQRTVLAVLAAAGGEVVTVDRLVDATWGPTPPSDPGHALQSQVSRIRRALGDDACTVLVHTSAGYRLELPPGSLDADVFRDRAARAQSAWEADDLVVAAAAADEAMALWRAAPYPDVRDSGALRAETNHLDEVRLGLLELRAEVALGRGEPGGAIAQLVPLVEDHPYREGFWLLLARALAASGRQHEALARLRDLRRLLQEDLGADAGPEVDRLYARILQGEAVVTGPAGSVGSVGTVPAALAATLQGRWVGRDEDIRQLVDAWREAGRVTVALVSGEAGIGKTRLAAEVARRLADQGATILYGGCTRDLAMPHEPFLEALGVSSLAELDPPNSALLADPASRRRRVAARVGDRLVENPAGTLLVLDDLHWSDAGTLEVLGSLARRPPSGRVLVLGTVRDTDVDAGHGLVELQADLRRHGPLLQLRLEGLGVHAVAELIDAGASWVRDPAARTRVATHVRGACAGNPFFVTAVIDALGRDPTARADGRLPLPDEVRDVVAARLARLAPATAPVIGMAALLEPAIDVALLAAAMGDPVDDVIRAMDDAARAGLVAEVEVGRYRFIHDITRTAVLRTQSRSRLARGHLALATELEARGGHPADVAHHLRCAGDDAVTRERAARASIAAGEAALAAVAPVDAATQFGATLDLAARLEDVRAELEGRARLGLGIAQREAGDPRFRETLLALAGHAERTGDDGLLVAAALENHRGMWSSLAAPDLERVAVLDRAIARARSDRERARLLARLAIEVVFAPDRDPAPLLERALALALGLDDDRVLAEVRFAQVTAGWGPETAAGLHAVSEELVSITRALGDPVALAHALMWHSVHLRTAGCTREARDVLAEAVALAEQLDHDLLRLFGSGYLCAQAMLEGDVAAASEAAEAVLRHGIATGQPDVGSWYVSILAVLRLAEGRLAEMLDPVLERASSEDDELAQVGPFRGVLVQALMRDGRHDEARALWAEVADALPSAPRDFIWLQTVAVLALSAEDAGDPDRAAALRAMVAPHTPQFINGGVVMWGALDHVVGLLAAASGDATAASAAFERAERLQEAAGARLWQVHTTLARARHLLRTGGDAAVAEALADEASAEAHRLGCPALADAGVALRR